jgi:hypothetical protein
VSIAEPYSFTLVLARVSEFTPELANSLYEATDAEIELEMRHGVATLEVQRRAKGLREAILATIRALESTPPGVRVVVLLAS